MTKEQLDKIFDDVDWKKLLHDWAINMIKYSEYQDLRNEKGERCSDAGWPI